MQMIEGSASPADVEKLESYAAQIRLALSGIDELVSNIYYVVSVPESVRLEEEELPERTDPTFLAEHSGKMRGNGSGELIFVHTFPG